MTAPTLLIPQEAPLMRNGQLTTSWRQFFSRLTTNVAAITQIVNTTPTAATGTITTGSAFYSYSATGSTVSIFGQVAVSNNGTGAGAILVALPALGRYFTQAIGSGVQITSGAITGTTLQVTLGGFTPIPAPGSYSSISFSKVDGTYPTLGPTDTIYFNISCSFS